ncbi:MAG: hypothetical protein ACRDRX_11245 [Pseudonocardiaceae bacterium]
MSGPKTAGYQISAAQQARLREQERLRALHRQWQAVQQRHHQLQLRATRLRESSGVRLPVLSPLPAAGSPATELAAALAVASEVVSRGEAELSRQERLAREAIARRLVAGIVVPVAPPSIPTQDRVSSIRRAAPAAVSDAPARDKDLARAAEIMAKLDPQIEPSEQLTGLVTALGQADAGRRRILIEALGADVRALNAQARSRRTQSAAIAEAERVVQQTDDRELRNLVAQLRVKHRDRGAVDLAALRGAVEAALRRDAAGRERRFVEQVVLDAFRGLGYEVLTGFEVQTPEGGALLRRERATDHAVRVVVRDGRVDLQAVRTRREPPPSRADDLHAEQQLCETAPRLWQALRAEGVEVDGVTSVPIGREVPPVVTLAEHHGADPTRPRRTPQPKERHRR